MLEPVGLDEGAERAYRLLLHRLGLSPQELADAHDLTAHQARQSLDRLVASGLATVTGRPARYTAIDPRHGLTALIRARQAELDAATTALESYAAEYHERVLRADPRRLVEVIEGPAAVADRLRDLVVGAEQEILAFDTPPYLTVPSSMAGMERDALARGVTVRAVYAAEVLRLPGRAEPVKELAALGEQARVVPRVPLKMVMADRRAAMIPLTSNEESVRTAAVLVRQSRLCDALVELFEAKWFQGAPVFAPAPTTDRPDLSPAEQALLSLLNSGFKDEAIARQLGVSERTLRRRTAELVERLGATSRFQAGAQAVRRGWV
ncbi:LuxR C-terminal-related transcriptional regulator [Streptomyces sp. NPDC008163]|uniref:helix-turn-helix transcriptional regulator n=1 Tax=Streptomyces sp. NPDC008163 TaxID=3364818 RepID=UPI0036E274B4